MTGPYDDIISLPHHQSDSHPRMPSGDRAVQFSPFAALTGYEEAVRETARLTETRVELDEYAIEALNGRLCMIQDALPRCPEISVTYFVRDKRKAGGSYVTASGCVKHIDENERLVIMADGTRIPIDDIRDIQGRMFDSCADHI